MSAFGLEKEEPLVTPKTGQEAQGVLIEGSVIFFWSSAKPPSLPTQNLIK